MSVYERLEALNIGRCGDRAFVLPYSVRPRQIWVACERLERAALSWLGRSDGISHHGLTDEGIFGSPHSCRAASWRLRNDGADCRSVTTSQGIKCLPGSSDALPGCAL